MLTRLLRWLVKGGADRDEPGEEMRGAVDEGADPARASAACREAVALLERGQINAAEKLLREAIEFKHDLAEAHFRLGKIHEQRGELEDAADCHELAVHFEPGHVRARFALAGLHKTQGRHAVAAEHYRRVIEHHPEDAAAHCNLCFALYEAAEYSEARARGERAIELDPRLAEAHHNLGLVLMATGEPAQAARCFRRALELKPLAEVAAGLAHAYRDLGRLDEAIAAYDRALRLAPGFGDAVINRAYAFLLKGDFGAGWAEYEHRFAATRTGIRDFGLPRWEGEPLHGKTILVHAEQGMGDEIMFASCLPDLIAVAGRVVIECSDRLEALFRRSFPQAMVHGGKKEDPVDWLAQFPPVHCQVPVGSLPRWFRSGRAAFSRAAGYLRADAPRVREWRARIGAAAGKPVIGLSWRGGTAKTRSHLRSVPLEALHGLLRPEFVFVSLQHGVVPSELQAPVAVIRSFPGVTENLDELAALIGALDLVVSVDNTNVHLAGALGRPVWVLLSPSPEWRYGLSGEAVPWYPSARAFRREQGQGWDAVVARLEPELERLLLQPRSGSAPP
jgi:tetratricopeptide (TPR) repeat protein